MKTFSSKLLYYSMYQYITKVLPTIFGNYTLNSELRKSSKLKAQGSMLRAQSFYSLTNLLTTVPSLVFITTK